MLKEQDAIYLLVSTAVFYDVLISITEGTIGDNTALPAATLSITAHTQSLDVDVVVVVTVSKPACLPGDGEMVR